MMDFIFRYTKIGYEEYNCDDTTEIFLLIFIIMIMGNLNDKKGEVVVEKFNIN